MHLEHILVQRRLCPRCECFWLSHPLASASGCPQCHRPLTFGGLWQVERHSALPWWLGGWAPGGVYTCYERV